MNLLNILYEPYFIIIFIALLITVVTYFIVSNKEINNENEEQNSVPKTLLYTFIISLVILILSKFAMEYMNKHKFFQKGGDITCSDRLTIIADDVDTNFLE